MANIRKSFNLRSGVQVDEDNLLVNSVGNVGLGTTVPTETLDVRGNIKSVGKILKENSGSQNILCIREKSNID